MTGHRKDYKGDTNARDTKSYRNDRSPLDKSQELIEWYNLWVLMDMDGDGISERWNVAIDYKGTLLLKKETCESGSVFSGRGYSDAAPAERHFAGRQAARAGSD